MRSVAETNHSPVDLDREVAVAATVLVTAGGTLSLLLLLALASRMLF